MSFRLVPKSVTFNDLERRKGRYFALFHRNGVRCHRKTIISISRSTFYSARNAGIASAVLATAIPSVCPSVCPSVRPSVRHTPVLCQNDGT